MRIFFNMQHIASHATIDSSNACSSALHETLLKTAIAQTQKGMHPNNVLAAFSNLNACTEIKQKAEGLVNKAASTIQHAWLSRKKEANLQTDTPEDDQSHHPSK